MKALLQCRVPAPGNVDLATDVYLPAGPGPFPTILTRTPYHKTGLQSQARTFVERGYAFVAQDCRGKYDSQGHFAPLVDEATDGQATLDWVAEQRWCNGRIGMWGRSYLGIVQIPAAAGGHPALRCIAPSVAPGSYFRDWLRYDGCFALANAIRWSLTHASCRTQPALEHVDWDELCQLQGPQQIAEHVGFQTPALQQWAEHDTYDDNWHNVDWDHMYSKVQVPALHSGGWFDHLTRTQYESFQRMDGEQRLLIGPWGHTTVSLKGPAHSRYGDWEFGAAADVDLLGAELRFFDLHLQDVDDGYADTTRARLFLMGENRWINTSAWPPPDSRQQAWHLDANSRLSPDVHGADGEDVYLYDPDDPVPTRGGSIYWGLAHAGPVDVRSTQQRQDVLSYRSDPLDCCLTVCGDVSLELHIATDVEDTDFVARLCVEQTDGTVICLTQGQMRCSFRQGPAQHVAMVPHMATELRVPMGQTAYTFAAGSRVVLLVTSSDFPRILPHRNRLGPLWGTEPTIATQRVLRGQTSPSQLQLPVVEGL